MGFGDFHDICQKAQLPLCSLVGHNDITNGVGVQPTCYPRNISLANTIIFQGAASFVHIGALIMTVIMLLHIRSKFTAVGRKEITTFFLIFFVLEVFSLLLDAGVVPPGSQSLPWFSAVQNGLSSALILSLCINGFLGFQVYEDGTALSVWLLRGLSAVWGGITFLVSILTYKGIGGLGPNNTVGLFIVLYVFNAVLLAIYLGMQILLVLGTLQDWFWPMGHISFGVFFFVVGQVILYALSDTICDRAQHYVDGLFFATLTNLLGVMMVYKYWDSITTEDLEFSVGTKVGGWDVKESQPMLSGDYDGSTMMGGDSARASRIYNYNSGEFSRSSLGLSTPVPHQRHSYMKGTPSPHRDLR
ncbi:MAG: hypothetical protein Q9162_000901 [Coniocarpon cinnabarinum]